MQPERHSRDRFPSPLTWGLTEFTGAVQSPPLRRRRAPVQALERLCNGVLQPLAAALLHPAVSKRRSA